MKFHYLEKSNTISALQIFPILEDEFESILKEFLPNLSISKTLFSGKKDSQHWVELEGKILLFIGLGNSPKSKDLQTSFRRILAKNEDKITDQLGISFSERFSKEEIEQMLIGLKLGSYKADFYKQERSKSFNDLEIAISAKNQASKSIIDRAEKIANSVIQGFKLVDLPPNTKTPEYLANWAQEMAKSSKVEVTILEKEAAEQEGLHAFLAVSRGSAKAPRFIVMDYQGEGAKNHLGLVGKGVTFDTGGLNIKTQGMIHMKSDMGGAAAVLATVKLVADLKLPIRLTAIVPAVENAIDKDAYLPSEVISSHAGLSIEVVDTDAEGRLILADGLSYLVENYQPESIIDLATLTGSSVGTFGYECGALFSNNDQLSSALQKAGMDTGEKLWPLPIWEEYKKEMDSDIADIRNYHGKPIAGAITAAKFLEAFIHEHPSWAHLDIAGVAFGDNEFSKGKTGTAFGVQLLLKFIENLS